MKSIKASVNIITAIGSSILCFALIMAILAMSLYIGVRRLGTPKQIVRIAQNLDIESMVKGNSQFKEVVRKYNITDEQLKRILESNAAKEILRLYSNDISEIFKRRGKEKQLTPKNVSLIINENYNDLADIFAKNEKEKMMALAYKDKIDADVLENAEKVLKTLPTSDVIYSQVEKKGYSALFNAVTNPDLLIYLSVIIGVLVAALIALRYFDWSGFLWLTGAFGFSSALVATINLLLSKGYLNFIIGKFVSENSLAKSTLNAFVKGVYIEAVILIIAEFVCLGIYAVIKFLLINSEKCEKIPKIEKALKEN